ncbi:MAG TPA: fructosamine kinase family protein [Accumulibacter sp.]|nr:fructosamine kinase family protein [Accumulibacter sp.]HMW18328.1 fructosamine kinase family protein [Accumulibacter sp.]HMX22973.1 fructosamine kinase family protein [Accumulibacter sp.]HMY06089.1 fructosamine kinase family protein [Accumulibacter sp.]HNC18372.1 fructosamine kinase family protein [Accumulibacter sp.]
MPRNDFHLPSTLVEAIRRSVGDAQERTAEITSIREIGGGSISRSFLFGHQHGQWFVKINTATRAGLFAAETDGLQALAACSQIRVPQVFGQGCHDGYAFLVLEHLGLRPWRETGDGVIAGHALARLHGVIGEHFGWHRDNFIGSTPQHNAFASCWPDFFASQRLLPQIEWAKNHRASAKLIDRGQRLVERMSVLFDDHQPAPSLVHGDLWYGNAAIDVSGRLALFDPAVYFGDREADLAMCRLFGGFPDAFFAAYGQAWPLPEGHVRRRTLYNLYHVLNHFNLFGGGYQDQAERMIDELLADIGT